MFNPRPQISLLPITAGQSCLVIDDALAEPERWVRLAHENQGSLHFTGHNAYPGPELRMPDAISERLDEYFSTHIRQHLGARRTLRMYSRLSMVTLAPQALQPRQWICHRDRLGADASECVAASVLYLFKNVELGGTNFFVARKSAADIDRLVADSMTAAPEHFTARYGFAPGYMTESNDWFEKVLSVPARWNRAIFYDGSLFHCSDIRHPEKLSADPMLGRLTYNGFFTCSRKAA
jgi:hypothetical protein